MLTKKPAKSGCDYVRDENGAPILKTRKGWQLYANRLAAEHTRRDNFAWFGVLWECPEYIRINMAGDRFTAITR